MVWRRPFFDSTVVEMFQPCLGRAYLTTDCLLKLYIHKQTHHVYRKGNASQSILSPSELQIKQLKNQGSFKPQRSIEAHLFGGSIFPRLMSSTLAVSERWQKDKKNQKKQIKKTLQKTKNKKNNKQKHTMFFLFFFWFSEMCLGLRIWRQSRKKKQKKPKKKTKKTKKNKKKQNKTKKIQRKNKKKHTMDYCLFLVFFCFLFFWRVFLICFFFLYFYLFGIFQYLLGCRSHNPRHPGPPPEVRYLDPQNIYLNHQTSGYI